MIREALRQRITPLVEQFVDDLAGLVEQRVERDLAAVAETLHDALSLVAGELASVGPIAPAVVESPPSDSSAPVVSAVEESPRPTQRSKGRPRLTRQRPYKAPEPAVGNVAELHRVPTPDRDADAAGADTSRLAGKKVTCKTCGFVGGNARGCGRSHPTQRIASPAVTAIVDGGASAEVKEERRDTLAELVRRKKQGALPVARASFAADDGEVRELDFGDVG